MMFCQYCVFVFCYDGVMLVLIHSSKTMRPQLEGVTKASRPDLLEVATELSDYLKSLSVAQVAAVMKVSPKLAASVVDMIASWSADGTGWRPALDSFIGDIYSGLQAQEWSAADRAYADGHMRILSGLYGALRPGDGVKPYRLEMGYRLPDEPYRNLYKFWGDRIARTLPSTDILVNLTAAEYSKAVLPYLDKRVQVVSPQFLTQHPKTGQPSFVVVHAKIARGAFAGWLVRDRISDVAGLAAFDQLGYRYDAGLSTPLSPVFVCKEFGGIGLSVRLA